MSELKPQKTKVEILIDGSKYISRDFSWVSFNHRVLDQAKGEQRTIFDRLKFLAITASNLDEFFMIRVGSLYNYIDYNKKRLDYSGLREDQFHDRLYEIMHRLVADQYECFHQLLSPQFAENGFQVAMPDELLPPEMAEVEEYFERIVFPMLTPMVFDQYHTFPILQNQILIFCVTTRFEEDDHQKVSFVQIPKNLPRFYEIEREEEMIFVPIEAIIRQHMGKLFRNIAIESVNLFRITRNGDFTLEESEDLETDFIDEIKRKLQSRKTGRVVRVEIEPGFSEWVKEGLKERWKLRDDNFFEVAGMMDFTGLWQIVRHSAFSYQKPPPHYPVSPVSLYDEASKDDVFHVLKQRDILLHHPFNSPNLLLELLEKASVDPNVLSIKLTIYRLAKESRVVNALLKAAENGKHVSALFELKARFDEENNIRESKRLQEAGCFVIHGMGMLKTHTKLLLIVRKEGDQVTRYVHMSSGNYNEDTARLYTDIGLLSTREEYGQDVSEFFNVITGHSAPRRYDVLITAPRDMRNQLIDMINKEAEHAAQGHEAAIVIKVNSLQDDQFMDALYQASAAGVTIKLIVRGICCLRPGREGLSENIEVRSLVGDYLEHSRIFYFHNNGNPSVFGGSADAMVRSFDRRVESMFQIIDDRCKKEAINILAYALRDNVNAYQMQEDGEFLKMTPNHDELPFNSHEEFYNVTSQEVDRVDLYGQYCKK